MASRSEGRLAGKVAVVTGAASGIGRATALLFAAEGADIVAVDLATSVEETIHEVERIGGKGEGIVGDSAEPATMAKAVAAAEALGGLEVMFANAGMSGGLARLPDLTPEQWMGVLRLNTLGAFLAVQAAAGVMAPRGRGSIICNASIAGLRAGSAGMHYSASKAAVISIVQTAANELAGSGVRINAVCPGLIETGMSGPLFEEARRQGREHQLGRANPLRRTGSVEEVARATLFLASTDSSYVNGHVLVVDGGQSTGFPVPGRV